jgi:hypothetical protein
VKARNVLLLSAAFVLAIGTISSCGDDPAVPSGTTVPSWVAWRNPNAFSYSYGLNAIWGNASRDLYAVGEYGMVLHYDGREWSVVRYGEEGGFNDVWGSSAGRVFAVGHDGAILHCDGQRCARMASGTAVRLNAVWGRGWYDVYAVGEAGTVLHFDGRKWSSILSGTNRTLHGVWGDGLRTFAVGDDGTILRLTPRDAQHVDVPTTNDLYGIGGSSTTGLYAVGALGTVLHYDGSRWRPVKSGTIRDLSNVRGTEDGHVIVTAGSRLLHFDGREWGFMDVAPEGDGGFVDVWGLSMSSLFLLQGDKVLHYDGATPSAMELPVRPRGDAPGQTLVDIWGPSANDVYAVGRAGAVLHYDRTSWTPMTAGGSDLETIWGFSESRLFAVSTVIECLDMPPCFDPPCPEPPILSTILSFDGTTWSEMNVLQRKWIRRVWTSSEDFLLAVGSLLVPVYEQIDCDFYRTILRYDGTDWRAMIDETTPGRLNDVWGASESDVFAVGSGGTVLHYDGLVWAEMASGTTEDLYAVWGTSVDNAVAVGAGGVILRFNGQAWFSMGSGTTKTIHDVWGSSVNDVFAVGEAGTILHFDGSTWKLMPSPTENTLYAVWGAAPDDVFAVGEYGTICHYGSQ